MGKIRIKRFDIDAPPANATVSHYYYGPNHYIRIRGAGIDIQIGANAKDLLDLLEPIVATIHAANGSGPGIVAMQAKARENLFYKTFNLITIDDIKHDMTTAEKLALLIGRFENSEQMHDIVQALKDDYRAATGRNYDDRPLYQSKNDNGSAPAPAPADPLDVLRPHADELINPDGTPKWGAQSKVAKLLGLPGTGGSYRRQILDVLNHLRTEAVREAA